jgi:hypothetical protein
MNNGEMGWKVLKRRMSKERRIERPSVDIGEASTVVQSRFSFS